MAPTDKVIRLPMAHRMANARVTLTKVQALRRRMGADRACGASHNLIREATINLADGTVRASGA